MSKDLNKMQELAMGILWGRAFQVEQMASAKILRLIGSKCGKTAVWLEE